MKKVGGKWKSEKRRKLENLGNEKKQEIGKI